MIYACCYCSVPLFLPYLHRSTLIYLIIGTLICTCHLYYICTVGFVYIFRQWRHCHIGAIFLLLLVRHDHYYPACGVKLITDNLIHDTLAIRKVHTYAFTYVMHMYHLYIHTCIINPQRTCTVKVTVLGLRVCVLSVCLSVCLSDAYFSNVVSLHVEKWVPMALA